MHDIGRTVREAYETDYEQMHEHSNEMHEGSTLQEYENPWGNEFAYESTFEVDETSPFNEMMELELATELLEVQSEEELDQFLGKLIKRAVPGVRNFMQSNAGRALGGVLKRVAKHALPIAGKVVGGMFGGPIGAKIGGGIGRFASRAFGLELEGLSAEDQEFELSKAFVRFAGAAAKSVKNDPKTRVQPKMAVRNGVIKAAKVFAPGLLVPMPGAYRANRDTRVYDHRDYETWETSGTGMQEF